MTTKALNRGGGVLFVTHRGPDFDAQVCGTNEFLDAGVWFKRGGKVATIDPNETYRGPVEPGTKVVHGDVGGIFDPENGFKDHHWPNGRIAWPSAAGIFLAHSKKLQANPAIVEMNYRADRVDSATSNGEESKESIDARLAINEVLKQFNRTYDANYFVVSRKRGPYELAKLLQNLEIASGEISDEMKLIVGMHLLRAWIMKENGAPVFKRQVLPSEDIPENAEFVFVLPTDSDVKNEIAVFLWQQANDVEIGVQKIGYVFVNPGERFSGKVPAGAKVVHIGTGKIFNPQTDDYDPNALDNGQRKTWYSAAVMIFHKNQKIFMTDPQIKEATLNLVRMTRNEPVDLPEWKKGWDSAEKKEIDARIADLNAQKGFKLMLVENAGGPYYLADLFERLETEQDRLENRERLEIVLYSLNGWYNIQVVKPILKKLVERAERIYRNGLDFIIIPETFLSSSTVRHYLRNKANMKYHGYIDVCIASYKDPARGFGVTRLFDDGKVIGMEEVFNALCKTDPSLSQQNGIYLTSPHFALYLTRKTVINDFDLFRVTALRTLRSAEAVAA